MAYELPGQVILGTLTASSDYNDAADQFCFVTSTGTNFKKVTTAGAPVLGVLQDRPSSGTAGAIAVSGVTKVRVLNTTHTAIAVMDKLRCSTLGGAMPSTANVGYYVVGRALEALGSNTTGIITMLITHQGAGSSGTPSGA